MRYCDNYETYLFCRAASDIISISILINGCGLLQMASYRKQLAVVAERIRCIGQETER